jgi:hypothetical protein
VKRAEWALLLLVIASLLFIAICSGCAAQPKPSPLLECINVVSKGVTYQGDVLKAADWCAAHVSP